MLKYFLLVFYVQGVSKLNKIDLGPTRPSLLFYGDNQSTILSLRIQHWYL